MALGLFSRAGVIHHMVFEILREIFSGIQLFFESGMGNVTRHDNGTGQ